MRVRAFAELTFRDSARLSFARACERVDHDVTIDFPQAWVVDDRRISLSLEADMTQAELGRHQRLLEELTREASSGEATIDAEGAERWTHLVGHQSSGIPYGRVSDSTEIDDEADTDISSVVRGGSRS